MPGAYEISFSRPSDDTLQIRLAGSWLMQDGLPSSNEVQNQTESHPPVRRITFDTQEITDWDSGLLTFLTRVVDQSTRKQIQMDREGLPSGVRRLLELAEAVPEKEGARAPSTQRSFLEQVGTATIGTGNALLVLLSFLGEVTLTFFKMLRMKARYRTSDLMLLIQGCGADALPIVTLISFLVGAILAFVGAVQLQQFGAQIYVADLVGIAMVREMGAMMTGIIMAGRTGAAYAAQLGTMKVTQEIDALTTMGFSPLEFLVLPRMVALILMMPLLCLYADLMGILGGAVVGLGMLDLSWTTYAQQTAGAVKLADLFGGVFKASVYGVLIAISGCLRGLQCGNSASSVGDATTSAVVTGIVFIIAANGMFAVIFYVLGI
ncbi:MAG: ABC transporter permease [Deltaproteobacteria bacterium]|nr:ABC transporter permease [Deltaproteobacteria bacterium]